MSHNPGKDFCPSQLTISLQDFWRVTPPKVLRGYSWFALHSKNHSWQVWRTMSLLRKLPQMIFYLQILFTSCPRGVSAQTKLPIVVPSKFLLCCSFLFRGNDLSDCHALLFWGTSNLRCSWAGQLQFISSLTIYLFSPSLCPSIHPSTILLIEFHHFRGPSKPGSCDIRTFNEC